MKRLLMMVTLIFSIFMMTEVVNASSLNCNKNYKNGSYGTNVKILQEMLNKSINCGLKEDGIFGIKTKNCVIKFQTKYGLVQDGIVGYVTCRKLNSNNISVNSSDIISSNTLVVIGDVVNVRKSATVNSSSITKLTRGTKVTKIGKKNNWYKVKLSNNKIGYIREDLVSNSMIIVDISDQKLYFSKDGKLILEANVVTGQEGSHDTPIGNYVLRLYNKQINTTLRGYNDNGTPYASYVNYWMPFNGGIGFHDASWRTISDYNTDTYKINGSHGCVNMMYEDVSILYNNIGSDTLVIVRK